jgi:hypothetical protein
VAVVKKDALWTYFVGMWPMYSHAEDDQASFRFIAAQLIESGVCRQVEFAQVLGQSRKRKLARAWAFFPFRKPRSSSTTSLAVFQPFCFAKMCEKPVHLAVMAVRQVAFDLTGLVDQAALNNGVWPLLSDRFA